jgi:hypothetical protein
MGRQGDQGDKETSDERRRDVVAIEEANPPADLQAQEEYEGTTLARARV